MDAYIVMLLVTVEQEKAIQLLLEEKKWKFCKMGSRTPLKEELNAFAATDIIRSTEACSESILPLDVFKYCSNTYNLTNTVKKNVLFSTTDEHVKSDSSPVCKNTTSVVPFPLVITGNSDNSTVSYHQNIGSIQQSPPGNHFTFHDSTKENLHHFEADETTGNVWCCTSNTMMEGKDLNIKNFQSNGDALTKLGQDLLLHVYRYNKSEPFAIQEIRKIIFEMMKVYEGNEKVSVSSYNACPNSSLEKCRNTQCKMLSKTELSEEGTLRKKSVLSKHAQEGSIKPTVQRFHSTSNDVIEQCDDSDSTDNYNSEIDKAHNNTNPKPRKHSWTVNRNIRMHACHRKCESIPSDLTEDFFSSSNNGYYCLDCRFIFTRKNKLKLHKQLKNGACSPHCIYCDKDDLRDIFQCHLCPKCFPSQASLDIHISRHSCRFKCNLCDSVAFYTALDLKVHQKKVHRKDLQVEYLCDLCGAKFSYKKVLNEHRKFVHTDLKQEQCQICNSRFKTKSQLRNHHLVHKSASEGNLSCEICGKRFRRTATLKDHVRRHNKEYSDFCSICGKGFYKNYDLLEHMRIHSGVKPHKCKNCGYTTALKCNLIKHMRTHEKHTNLASGNPAM